MRFVLPEVFSDFLNNIIYHRNLADDLYAFSKENNFKIAFKYGSPGPLAEKFLNKFKITLSEVIEYRASSQSESDLKIYEEKKLDGLSGALYRDVLDESNVAEEIEGYQNSGLVAIDLVEKMIANKFAPMLDTAKVLQDSIKANRLECF